MPTRDLQTHEKARPHRKNKKLRVAKGTLCGEI